MLVPTVTSIFSTRILTLALPREQQAAPLQIHCNVYRRAGVLPVGETSRSDRGGGVSAEECSRRNLSIQCHLLSTVALRVVEGADTYKSNATFIAWTLRPIFSELFYLMSHARIRINTGFYFR